MSYVIEYSQHKGGALLCLLMIANHADRFGRNSFPGLATLAAECRMSERQIYRLISVIEGSGELKTEREGGGRGKIKGFQIVMGNPDKMSSFSGVDNSGEAVKSARQNPDIYGKETLTFTVKKGDILGRYKENHLSEINLSDKESGPDGPVLVDKKKKKSGIPEAIAAAADPIYQSDPKRFRNLVKWIRQKMSEKYPSPAIIAALEEFRERMATITGEWWPYLDEIGKKVRTEFLQREAEKHKGEIPGLFGQALRSLVKDV